MRFLDTTAVVERGVLEFRSIADYDVEKVENAYAILSHRWGDDEDEVKYADVLSGTYHDKPGSVKLSKFCEIAASFGCRYGWADTCCIDKTNSTELTEAINSMFRWYRDSKVCIANLKDVPDKPLIEDEWFSRGWTLQELIAPRNVQFYDRNWASLGTKGEKLTELEAIHRIPSPVLRDPTKLSDCSVAQRISWASGRQTRRVEDQAYALMGILDVNMPTIYGEGDKAFILLQQAIMQQSKDESLFAWEMEDAQVDDNASYSGLFAPSPKAYANCGNVSIREGSRGFSEANGEVSIRLKMLACSMETFCVTLNCGETTGHNVGIFVKRTSIQDEDEFVRVTNREKGGRRDLPSSTMSEGNEKLIRVPIRPSSPPLNIFNGFWLHSILPPDHDRCMRHTLSSQPGWTQDLIGSKGISEYGRTSGLVYLRPESLEQQQSQTALAGWSKVRWIKLGFDSNSNPMLYLATDIHEYPMMPTSVSKEKPLASLFDQAINDESKSTGAFAKLFHDKWTSTPGYIPSRTNGWRDGLTVIRFDRKMNVDACIDALNIRIHLRLVPWNWLPLSIRENFGKEELSIWTLTMTAIEGSDPEQEFHDHLLTIKTREFQVRCERLFCCDYADTENDLEDLQSKMRLHRSNCKILNATDLDRVKLSPAALVYKDPNDALELRLNSS